jgi:RHS repeat-associated protein
MLNAFIYDSTPRFVRCTSKFTGKERDQESGNDYFGARYYASSMGRFMSPDPSGLDYADFSNPQTLNLYAYAVNNPLRYIDPTGLVLCDYGSSDQGGEDYEDADDNNECTSVVRRK